MIDQPLIVLSLEGLATSALSCYGSSWNQTPAMDGIASTAAVWDRWIATSDSPRELLRGVFESREWTSNFRSHGTIELFTDTATLLDGVSGDCFDHIEALQTSSPESTEQPVSEIVDTQFGQLIAAAMDRDAKEEPWSVLWLHSDFLTKRWDAPRELFPIDEIFEDQPSDELELLVADSDSIEPLAAIASIFDSVIPPHFKLDSDPHPDLVTAWMRTYGCQVRLADLLIEVLLQSLEDYDPQVIVLGASGFQLGQNGWIGNQAGPLRSPEVRLPMIVSDCGPLRFPQLTPSSDLLGLLGGLCDRDASESQQSGYLSPQRWRSPTNDLPPVTTLSNRAKRAVTTPTWFCVQDEDDSEHLFLKPDDADDCNDVGRIRTDVIDQLLP
ncbi:MAG: hypothetical protein AB8B91_04450 [Rubripirellula sp.]